MLPAPPLPPHIVNEIRFRYLTDETMTIAKLAELYQHPAHRVSSLLKGKDYDTFKATVQQTLRQAAVDRLVSSAEKAADLWAAAMPIAAARGDHRPMKDLLIATKAIDATAQAQPMVVVQVGIKAEDVTIAIGSASVPALALANQPTIDVPADSTAPQPAASGHVHSPSDSGTT